MKLPELSGKQKIRNAKIFDLTIRENKSSYEVADYLIEHGLWVGIRDNVASLVRKTLYKHRESLIIDKNYERFKQIQRVKRQIEKRPDSTKDVADLEKLLCDILNGDKNGHILSQSLIVAVKVETDDGSKVQAPFKSENRLECAQ